MSDYKSIKGFKSIPPEIVVKNLKWFESSPFHGDVEYIYHEHTPLLEVKAVRGDIFKLFGRATGIDDEADLKAINKGGKKVTVYHEIDEDGRINYSHTVDL